MSVEFSAKYWREAEPFTKTERYSLVRCEPCGAGGVLIIATDGAQMAVFRDVSGICSEPITLPYSQLKCEDSDRIRLAPNVVFLIRDGVIAGGAVYPEKTYQLPEWRRIIPALPSSDPVYFNPSLLKQGSLGAESAFISVKGTVATVFPSRRTDAITFLAAMRSENKLEDWAWIAPAEREPETETAQAPPRRKRKARK